MRPLQAALCPSVYRDTEDTRTQRFHYTSIGSSGSTIRKVKTVELQSRSGNDANIYIGHSSSVTEASGREMVPGATLSPTFDAGSETWGNFFAVAGSGSSATLDWSLVFED